MFNLDLNRSLIAVALSAASIASFAQAPASPSSERMQADLARNAAQQQRIDNGVKSGALTNHEAAKLERGQARVDHKEAVAGANGHVSAAEQARIARAENRQSRAIHRQKHDAQVRG